MMSADMAGQGSGFRMERRSGDGLLIIFGLPFLAAGAFMLLTALQLSGVPMDEDLSPLFLLILGQLFTAAGIALIFGRSGAPACWQETAPPERPEPPRAARVRISPKR